MIKSRTDSIRFLSLLTIGSIGGIIGCSSDHDLEASRPAWNDINVIRENAEPPRAHFASYENTALGSSTIFLNGTWKFNYAESPAARPAGFHQQDYDVSAWDDSPVPSDWERQGYGHAIYVNVPYAFDIDAESEGTVRLQYNPRTLRPGPAYHLNLRLRWLSLSDSDNGLLISTNDAFSFGVHHNRMSDFVPPVKIAITSEDGPDARKNDERVNIHVSDVKPRELIALDIDYGQMGVGGDDSWGKRTLQKYSLNENRYHYKFTLRPYSPDSESLNQLVSRSPDTREPAYAS